MNPYRVLIVGMGKRGMHHATAFHSNPKFQVAGICDIDKGRLEAAAPKVGNPKTSTDAGALAKELKPDVFCFCTLPTIQSPPPISRSPCSATPRCRRSCICCRKSIISFSPMTTGQP